MTTTRRGTILVAIRARHQPQGLIESLRQEGFEVVAAENESDIYRELGRTAIDMLLIDPSSMGRSALDFAAKAKLTLDHFIVFALADETGVFAPDGVMEAGADLFLTKPIEARSVAAVVRRILLQAPS
jgi:DNA-binding response OmpR family regulator